MKKRKSNEDWTAVGCVKKVVALIYPPTIGGNKQN
jgi:hypothetical protein